MKIKRSPVIFHNVLCMTDLCKPGEWQTIALVMRNFVMQNGLYTNAPVIYQYVRGERQDGLNEFTIYLPINRPVELSDDIPMTFLPELKFDDALTFRIADVEDTIIEEAYLLLETCAAQQDYTLARPYFHVHMSLFGDNMLDVIAPIVAGEDITEINEKTNPTIESEKEGKQTIPVPLDSVIQDTLKQDGASK